MRNCLSVLTAAILLAALQGFAVQTVDAGQEERVQGKRAKIDGIASDTLTKLFEQSAKAGGLYDEAYGYAVFNNTKVSVGVTGGGGSGVAIRKGSGERTYMRMATGGLNLGLGGQRYQVVFLFQDEGTFNKFVNTGWEAGASANAVAGKAGANKEASFTNGLAVYQLTGAGLMLQADISGTKYWQNKRLN